MSSKRSAEGDVLQRRMSSFGIVVVGGGNSAGYFCRAFAAAKAKIDGGIAVLSAESVAPYERPALTKAYAGIPTAAETLSEGVGTPVESRRRLSATCDHCAATSGNLKQSSSTLLSLVRE